MKNEKKTNLSEEHLRKIKYRTNYVISESPRYRALVNDSEEFDAVPDSAYATEDGQPVPRTGPAFTSEAGDQEGAPKPEGQPPAEPINTNVGADAPVPAFDKTGGDTGEIPPAESPENQVDSIQNDIIKHNIEAMKSIHNQLEMLNSTVQGLNTKLAQLSADVEEVREPTNAEKLMKKTSVSYPYYFNLNDFWSGNWFSEKREKAMEKGIRELPDGTYVADFDDLPQKSKIDVQSSFNDIV